MSTYLIFQSWDMKIVTAKRKRKCKENSCADILNDEYQGTIKPGEKCVQVKSVSGFGCNSRNFSICMNCIEQVIHRHKKDWDDIETEFKCETNVLELKPREEYFFDADAIPF